MMLLVMAITDDSDFDRSAGDWFFKRELARYHGGEQSKILTLAMFSATIRLIFRNSYILQASIKLLKLLNSIKNCVGYLGRRACFG